MGFHGRGKGQRACLRRCIRILHRENRQRRVADETQHLPTVIEHRARHAIEELIEGAKEVFLGHTLRQRRRLPQIAEPDHRLDVLAVAALDASVEHALAGVPAEVGVQQRNGRAAHVVKLVEARQGREDFVHMAEIGSAEAAGPIGGKGERVYLSIEKGHGHGHVVGGAFGMQILEDAEIQNRFGNVQSPPNTTGAFEYGHQRAVEKARQLQVRIGYASHLHIRPFGPPAQRFCHDLGMQGTNDDCHPPQGNADSL